MTSIRTSIIAGFALTVATLAVTVSTPAQAQLLTSSQLKAYEASRGQPRCPRTVELTNDWVKQLTVAVANSRAKAEDNPIYWSDAGYYETELAYAKKCIQNVASIKR